jgi:ABC-type transporter Mla MlaB component
MAAERSETKTILLTGPITLYEISAVRESLRVALGEGKGLRIDLRDSGPWDLAGLQLLISCEKTARARGQSLRLVNIPGVCTEVATRSGLLKWLLTIEERKDPVHNGH